MRSRRWMLIMIVFSLLGMLLASQTRAGVWAAPLETDLGQTVPTRTPTAEPVTPTPLPVPTESPVPATENPAATLVPPPALLPVAGGEERRPMSSLLAITGFVLLALSGWRWLDRKRRQAG